MSGNHPSELSPRQRMINMMYLVLTALLALNVSKEVLNSFFEVNQGIERMAASFDSKNADTYAAFDAAFALNKVKAAPWKLKADSVKVEANNLVAFIQKMKYNLVLKADGIVYLGSESENKDEDGKLIEKKGITKKWEDLDSIQKTMSIVALSRKDDRNSAGDLFYSNKRKKNIATDLKNNMLAYKNFLTPLAEGNDLLSLLINETYDLSDKKLKKGASSISWEEYNFYDMPSVGALTLLSKMQSDVRNTEAQVIDMLYLNINDKSLKFTSAEGIQVPVSNFVLQGQTFTSEIFLSAKDTTQAPIIYVGDYKTLGNGNYEMIGDSGATYKKGEVYEVVKPVQGKGIYNRDVKASSRVGPQQWGGLIAMKTKTGTKMYPFAGEYLVAAKTAVVSPTKMNILYTGLEAIGGNPIKISVPGYTASEITPVMSNGTLNPEKKSAGTYNAFPNVGATSAVITLYVKPDGKKRSKMGEVNFRVRKTPPPGPVIKSVDANGLCDRSILKEEIVQATLENFLFDGLKYAVTSFKLSGTSNNGYASAEQKKGMGFTPLMKTIIANAPKGSTINITKIRAQLIGSDRPSEAVKGDLVIEIK